MYKSLNSVKLLIGCPSFSYIAAAVHVIVVVEQITGVVVDAALPVMYDEILDVSDFDSLAHGGHVGDDDYKVDARQPGKNVFNCEYVHLI